MIDVTRKCAPLSTHFRTQDRSAFLLEIPYMRKRRRQTPGLTPTIPVKKRVKWL